MKNVGGGRDVHIHGIAYSWDDRHKKGEHAVGNWTLILEVSAPDNEWDNNWWEEAFEELFPEPPFTDNFDEGCNVERDITFFAQGLSDNRAIAYSLTTLWSHLLPYHRFLITEQ